MAQNEAEGQTDQSLPENKVEGQTEHQSHRPNEQQLRLFLEAYQVLEEWEPPPKAKKNEEQHVPPEQRKRRAVSTLGDLAVMVRDRLVAARVPDAGEFSAEKLRRAVGSVEKALNNGEPLIHRSRGPGGWRNFLRDEAERSRHDHTSEIVRRVHEAVDSHERLFHTEKPFLIELGCTRVPGNSILVDAVLAFNEEYADKGAAVVLTHGLPHVVRTEGATGKYHIYCGSVETEKMSDHWEYIDHIELRLRLVLNRRNELAVRGQPTWLDLRDYLLLAPSTLRDPQILLPYACLPAGMAIRRAESYAELLGAVRSAGSKAKVACVAFPQVHRPEERLELRDFDMPGLGGITLGAYRSKTAWERTSQDNQVAVKGLSRHIKDRFGQLRVEAEGEALFAKLFPIRSAVVFHVSRRPRDDRIRSFWLQGVLEALVSTSSGYFRGEHRVYDRFLNKEELYTIQGHANFDRQAGVYHVSWRGSEASLETPQEDYSVSLMFHENNLREGLPWFGYWMGKSTLQGTPGLGYFVVSPQDYCVEIPPEDGSPAEEWHVPLDPWAMDQKAEHATERALREAKNRFFMQHRPLDFHEIPGLPLPGYESQ